MEEQKLINDINDGTLSWFCAKVTASKQGIELAQEYLGGCCYKSVNDFLEDGYYEDMKEQATREAKKIFKL